MTKHFRHKGTPCTVITRLLPGAQGVWIFEIRINGTAPPNNSPFQNPSKSEAEALQKGIDAAKWILDNPPRRINIEKMLDLPRKYKRHSYRFEVSCEENVAERVQLWVDEREIPAIPGTHFEPLVPGTTCDGAEEYAEHAAKQIIDHLIRNKITVDQAYR